MKIDFKSIPPVHSKGFTQYLIDHPNFNKEYLDEFWAQIWLREKAKRALETPEECAMRRIEKEKNRKTRQYMKEHPSIVNAVRRKYETECKKEMQDE